MRRAYPDPRLLYYITKTPRKAFLKPSGAHYFMRDHSCMDGNDAAADRL